MNSYKPPAINTLMKYQSGISLLETMAVLTILGILTAVAMPSFRDLVKNNRIASQANNLIASLHYARGETVTRGVSVRVEPVVAGTDWTRGWQVRIDGNSDATFDDAEDVVIRNYEGLQGSTLTTTAAFVTFNPAGDAAAVNTLTLRATECTGEHQRIIDVKMSGLVSLSSNKNC